MTSNKVIVSIENLPDEITSYLKSNYKFYDLSPYLKDYKTIKDYNTNKREKWDNLLKSLPKFEKPDVVIFRTYTILDKNLIDLFPENILFLRAGSGYDNIDIQYALNRFCHVENTPIANTNSAFEHTVALLFTSLKKLVQFNKTTKDGKWRDDLELNHEAKGKNICIVGYGNIGSKVASFAKFLGMNIFIYDPIKSLIGNYDKLPEFANYVEVKDFKNCFDFNYNTLYEIINNVDVVTFHIPLYDKTYKMIDERLLSYLKEKAILINTSRGELFEKNSTISYFKNNFSSILATDVLPEEPCYAQNPFFDLPNCIITPHIGAFTFEARTRLKEEVIKTLQIYLNEKRILYPVNPGFHFSPYFKY